MYNLIRMMKLPRICRVMRSDDRSIQTQHGSIKSERGNTLFGDSAGFYFHPTAFSGDDEVSVQGGSGPVSGGSDQTCFPSFFSPQLEAIVSHSYDGSLSSAEIYLSEDNWPLNPHLTTVKMPPQE